jgi:chemotaxis family two-component system response regulator Rcp1
MILKTQERLRPIEVLLIEDNPGDVRLLQEAFREIRVNIHLRVARDGAEGIEAVGKEYGTDAQLFPDLILLDLNLPKISGHDVLARIKNNPQTRRIPVIVFTSSKAETDVRRAYELYANAYLRKPSSLEGLIEAAERIKNFWMECVTLPQ